MLSSEYHLAYEKVQRLQEQLIILTGEREKLSLQVKEMDTGFISLEDYQVSPVLTHMQNIEASCTAVTISMQRKKTFHFLNLSPAFAGLVMHHITLSNWTES